MTVNIATETLVRISDAPAHCPTNPSIATVRRWHVQGIRGVHLETTLIGGRRYTSQEALARFFARTNTAPASASCA